MTRWHADTVTRTAAFRSTRSSSRSSSHSTAHARAQKLVASGFGEVVHLHHNFDTPQGLEKKLRDGLTYFERFGFAKTTDGETRFAFIHGLSGLDNSNGDSMCGVERELEQLRKMGCFADFTFPSVWEDSQPPFVNSIYDAIDTSSLMDGAPRSVGKGTHHLSGAADPSFTQSAAAVSEVRRQHPTGEAATRPSRSMDSREHSSARTSDWVFVKVRPYRQFDEDWHEMLGPNFMPR
jgi:hypothetical protein